MESIFGGGKGHVNAEQQRWQRRKRGEWEKKGQKRKKEGETITVSVVKRMGVVGGGGGYSQLNTELILKTAAEKNKQTPGTHYTCKKHKHKGKIKVTQKVIIIITAILLYILYIHVICTCHVHSCICMSCMNVYTCHVVHTCGMHTEYLCMYNYV